MKRFFIIFFFAVIMATPTDLKSVLGSTLYLHFQEKAFGGFNECFEYIYMYKSGQIDSNSKKLERKLKYDEKGNMVEEIIFGDDGKIDITQNYHYDDKGNKIVYFQSDYNYLDYKITYKYDTRGNRIERVLYDKNDSISEIFTYHYDEKNNLIKLIKYLNMGFDRYNSTTCLFDDNKNLYEEIIDDNGIFCKYTFIYNETGNIIEEKTYNKSNIIQRKSIYEYLNEVKVYQKILFYNENALIDHTFEFKYDKKGNYIEAIWYEENVMQLRYTYSYDSLGNQIEKTIYADINEVKNTPIKKYVYVFLNSI